MSDMSKDDDSVPSSPSDPEASSEYVFFQLKSNLSTSQIRKQVQLRNRIELLQRHNYSIRQKVRKVRERRKAFAAMSARKKLVQLAQANERRRRHLEQVREKARTLRTYLYRKPQPQFAVRREVPVNPTKIPKPRERSYNVTEIKNAVTIQKLVRNHFLRKALGCSETTEIITKVHSFDYSYHESVTLLTGAPSDKLSALLRALNMPSIKGGYSWFLYSVVLISDFQEFASGTEGSHPGFNVNVRDLLKNALSVHLPIILYRYATRIFSQLHRLLGLPFEEASDPTSLPRLVLARFWRQYHYFFHLYRCNHRVALTEIAAEALSIASTQRRIVLALEGRENRGFRQRVKVFDRSYRSLKAINPVSSLPWASIGVSGSVICKDITRAHLCFQTLEKNKSPLMYDPYLLADDNHQNSVVTLSKLGEKYLVPPYIGMTRWRQYFFDLYEDQITRQFGAPDVLRTGTRTVPRVAEEYLPGIMNLMSPFAEDIDMDDKPCLVRCDRKLKILFHEYYKYCKFIYDQDELNDILSKFDQLSSVYNTKELEIMDEAQAHHYLKLFMFLLLQLLLFASVNVSAAVSFLEKIDGSVDLLEEVEFLYKELEVALNAKWASACTIRSMESFRLFENLYQMTGIDLMRNNLGTNFPQLRFSLFYQFIFRHSQCRVRALEAVLGMVLGTQQEPNFNQQRILDKTMEYFSHVITDFLTSDIQLPVAQKLQKNNIGEIRMFSLFTEKVADLCFKLRRLLMLSCLSSMLNLNRHQCSVLGTIMNLPSSVFDMSPMRLILSDFHYKYLLQTASDLALGKWKLLDLFADKLRRALVDGSVQFLQGLSHQIEWRELFDEIKSFCNMFYMMYFPVLNWIYLDLGSPQYSS